MLLKLLDGLRTIFLLLELISLAPCVICVVVSFDPAGSMLTTMLQYYIIFIRYWYVAIYLIVYDCYCVVYRMVFI